MRLIAVVLLAFCCSNALASNSTQPALTLEERVAAQKAIEQVYWRHRVWPIENTSSKPQLSAVLSDAQIRARVERYLATPIVAADLAAEVVRMKAHTHDRQMLDELFDALGNDPVLIEETLARESAASSATCGAEGWQPTTLAGAPSPRFRHTAVWTGAEMIVWGGENGHEAFNTGGRYDPATDTWRPTSTGANVPTGRIVHTAIWTGTEMIVWGGDSAGGGRYNPTTDSWLPTSMGSGVPTPRFGHSAVWTGSEMIVWGGREISGDQVNTGARYNPSTDSWIPTSTGAHVPSPRFYQGAAWTGTEMLVWGGLDPSDGGGRYNPLTNSWHTIPSDLNTPALFERPRVFWTGTEMLVWGGCDLDGACPTNVGARYNPANGSWVRTSTGANVPPARGGFAAVWGGGEMLVWGGDPEANTTGGRYSPFNDTWNPIPGGAGAPQWRREPTAVWTGTEMIVWGGDYFGFVNTGGRYCKPFACDDGNDCTFDAVDSTGGCVHTPEPEGTVCDDGNACTGSGGSPDSCDGAGTCNGGLPPVIDDHNVCTTDYCDPETGAVFIPIDCDDGSFCNGVESCDPTTGCVAGTPEPQGALCDDGNACTGSYGSYDSCDGAGTCIGGDPVNVSDGSECTIDYCDPKTGAVNQPIECDDGNACNGVESCDPATGCVAGSPVPDGTTCDDGNSATSPDTCQNGVCVGESNCTSTHNPRTAGWWKDICHHGGTHQGETITSADAACVGSMSQTFAGITSVNQVCDVFDNNHSEGTSSKCEKAERDLMALALNICKERVCCGDGIDSHCDQSGDEAFLTFAHNNHGDDDDDDGNHDGDDDDDDDPSGEKSSVCESFDTADGLLSDPSRTDNECKQADCLSKEINNGHALEFATLVVRREGTSMRLVWLSPVLNDGTAGPSSYRIWRRPSRSTAPFINIGSSLSTEFVDMTSGTRSWEYEVTPVLPDNLD